MKLKDIIDDKQTVKEIKAQINETRNLIKIGLQDFCVNGYLVVPENQRHAVAQANAEEIDQDMLLELLDLDDDASPDKVDSAIDEWVDHNGAYLFIGASAEHLIEYKLEKFYVYRIY